jgi:hypothetical protein
VIVLDDLIWPHFFIVAGQTTTTISPRVIRHHPKRVHHPKNATLSVRQNCDWRAAIAVAILLLQPATACPVSKPGRVEVPVVASCRDMAAIFGLAFAGVSV